MRAKGGRFTEREDAFLRKHSGSMSHRDIAKRLGRSVRSIESRLRKLGQRKFSTTAFTADEDAVIRAAHGRSSVDVARQLGRSPAVVRMRAKRLGLGGWKQITPVRTDYRGYRVRCVRKRNGKYRRVPEHRAVMEDYLGRELADRERVHHINCDKRDNRLENLYLCASDAEHHRLHALLDATMRELLSRGWVVFDHTQGVYVLCETRS